MEYLVREEIVGIHDKILKKTGGLWGVSDEHALSMLEAQPAQYVFGKELYPGIFIKAAFYARAINGGHIFKDGNKRTSIAVINEFLTKNDVIFELRIEQKEEIEKFALDVAQNLLSLEEISLWIEKHSKSKKTA